MRRWRSKVSGAAALLGAALVAGCAAPVDGADESLGSDQASAARDGFVYFHGMGRLGFAREALRFGVGGQSVLAPTLTDAELQEEPSSQVIDYLGARSDAVAAGYSLGRAQVLRLMAESVHGMRRAVLVDPTYDSARGLAPGVGGTIARAWLEGDPRRSLLLVYGDVTRALGGERSYVRELAQHPRASLCFVRGDHERFRRADMVAALVARDCADLERRLASARGEGAPSDPTAAPAGAVEAAPQP